MWIRQLYTICQRKDQLSIFSLSQCTRRQWGSHRFKSRINSNNTKRTSDTGISKRKSNSSSSRVSSMDSSWKASLNEVVPIGGIFAWRLCLAYGVVYIFWEYGVEITICEGPSMIPTLKGDGDEIVLLDRWTPYRLGLQGGSSASQRAMDARKKQREFVQQLQIERRIPSYPKIWYEPKIPANTTPSAGMWQRLWVQLNTPVSVGDVVVLQHPHRSGTVCKRILGLPGDTVFTPRSQMGSSQLLFQNFDAYLEDGSQSKGSRNPFKRKSSNKVDITSTLIPYQTNLHRLTRQQRFTTNIVPDGHLWVEGDNPWNSNDSRNYGPIPASLIVGRVLCRLWPVTGTQARIERGERPIQQGLSSKSTWSFAGSIVFPAGYRNEVIVRDYQQWQYIVELQQLHQNEQNVGL
jgi:signal peptidase I